MTPPAASQSARMIALMQVEAGAGSRQDHGRQAGPASCNCWPRASSSNSVVDGYLHRTGRQRAADAGPRLRGGTRPPGRIHTRSCMSPLPEGLSDGRGHRANSRSGGLRGDRRNHLHDDPRLLSAPDQALPGRGRPRSGQPASWTAVKTDLALSWKSWMAGYARCFRAEGGIT